MAHSPGMVQGSPLADGLQLSEAQLMPAQRIPPVPVVALCSACGSSREHHLPAPTSVVASPAVQSPLQLASFMGAQALRADARTSNTAGVGSETGLYQGFHQGKTMQPWVPLHAIVQGADGGPNVGEQVMYLPGT